jgi:predicted ATP-grasp superfamily ATP-dependent carboligase
VKIIIFEYATGGGYIGGTIPPDIVAEGYSMLKTVIEDFQNRGDTVTTLIDSRLNKLISHLNPNELIEISKEGHLEKELDIISGESEYSLIIAPETDRILSRFVNIAGQNTISLNSDPDSIELISDKLNLLSILNNNNLPTPNTQILSTNDTRKEIIEKISTVTYPIIIKPINGIGCEYLNIINNEAQFNQKLNEILDNYREKRFLIQDYIAGLPVSVSLLTNGLTANPISLNLQKIILESPGKTSRYLGGIVPIQHILKENAFRIASQAVELFSGLKGYIGIDMVLSPRGPIILEINPRLTLSYVGIKKASDANLAEIMVNIAERSESYSSVEYNNVVVFQKVNHNNSINSDKFEVVYPGAMNYEENPSYALIASKCNNESQAMQLFSQISNY